MIRPRNSAKWQMDDKYIPNACCVVKDDEKFYHYTMIEVTSRERFLFPYKEQAGYLTADFVRRG